MNKDVIVVSELSASKNNQQRSTECGNLFAWTGTRSKKQKDKKWRAPLRLLLASGNNCCLDETLCCMAGSTALWKMHVSFGKRQQMNWLFGCFQTWRTLWIVGSKKVARKTVCWQLSINANIAFGYIVNLATSSTMDMECWVWKGRRLNTTTNP